MKCRSCVAEISFNFSDVSVGLRYAYAVASALHGVRHVLRKDFMIQVIITCEIFFYFILSIVAAHEGLHLFDFFSHHGIWKLGRGLLFIILMDATLT